MRLLKTEITLKFIVMGAGEREQEFRKASEGLYVSFIGRLPYAKMCGVLSACDIAVNPIMPGAAQSIINKHADFAASGIPVINTQESVEYRGLIDKFSMGFNCNNPSEIADKLSLLVVDENLRIRMGQNARRCAEILFDRRTSYSKIVEALLR